MQWVGPKLQQPEDQAPDPPRQSGDVPATYQSALVGAAYEDCFNCALVAPDQRLDISAQYGM